MRKPDMDNLPSFIKAATLVELNKPLTIKQLHCPNPEHGQVLVKIEYAGLCHSQLMEVRGKRGPDKYLPHLLGHEGVGKVIAIGSGVEKVNIGDRVVLGWIKGEGIDSGGHVYRSSSDEEINSGPVTTFSDYAIISENRVIKCPDEIPSKLAVLLGCALPTGAGMVLNELKPKDKSNVLIVGLGGIGLSALIAMQAFDLNNIVVIDVEQSKLDLAISLGATKSYLACEQGINEYWQDFPKGVEYAIESAGKCTTIELAFSLISQQGFCLFASHPPKDEKISIDPHQLISGKTIKGSWGGGCQPDKDIPKLVHLINKHNIPVEKFLSKEYTLENINDAFDDLEQRKIVRALIVL